MAPEPGDSYCAQVLSSLAIAVLTAVLALGCSDAMPDTPGRISLAVEGGQIDETHSAVFRVITRNDGFNGLCSSTLVAPNLLLTARHCVAANDGEDIQCDSEVFGATTDPRNLLFANDVKPDLASHWYAAADVAVPDDDSFCGNDIALVRLSESVPERVAKPVAPRLDSAPAQNEAYVAVGYGASAADGSAAEYGVRRFRDGLRVDCLGQGCGDQVLDGEFAGFEGVCRGDSGGPALDADGRVTGALSRGRAACESPVYTSVFAFRDWLVARAEDAARQGNTPLPAWAGGQPEPAPRGGTDAGAEPAPKPPPEQSLATEGGCTQSSGRNGGWALLLLLAGGVGFARMRRPGG